MLDFSKWAAMWDAYAESSPGDPTPGTPAAMCFNIGLIMVIGGIIGAIIRLTSESPPPHAGAHPVGTWTCIQRSANG